MTANATFRIVFFVLVAGMLLIRIYFNLRVHQSGERIMPDREAIRREGKGLFALRFTSFFVLLAVLVLYAIDHPWMRAINFPLPGWLRWLGGILGLLSIALVTWAEIELGRQFSPQLQLRQEHRLITRGPYQWVRHPLYTALYGYGLSLTLVSANWFFVAFLIVSMVFLGMRLSREEQMLIDQFGQDYQAYRLRTGRLFPRLKLR